MSHRIFVLGGTKGLGFEIAKRALDGTHVPDALVLVAGRTKPPITPPHMGFIPVALHKKRAFSLRNAHAFDHIFITAGALRKGPLIDCIAAEIEETCRVNFSGPVAVLNDLLLRQLVAKHPCHVTIVSSISSWKCRSDEAIYGAMKAAMAQFARNLGRELPHELPGSSVLLVNPGGMKTPFWDSSSTTDTRLFMDPEQVADIIWKQALEQCASKQPFQEIQVHREPDGSPRVEHGPRAPE